MQRGPVFLVFCLLALTGYHRRAVLSTPFLPILRLCDFGRIWANRLPTLCLVCIKTIPKLEGAKPCPPGTRFLSGDDWRWGPSPRPACGGPAGTPPPAPCSRRPAVRAGLLRSARACPPLRVARPERAVPPPGFGPRPGPWARSAPLRRACAPASVGLGLSARALARRSGPRCPPAAPAGAGRAPPPPVRPAPGGRGGPLSAPGSPWCFRLAWPAGSPRAARRLRRRLRPRSSRAGARGYRPAPRPRALRRRRSRSLSLRSSRMSAMA